MIIFLLIVIILILLFGAAAFKSVAGQLISLIAIIVALFYLQSATGISIGYLVGAALGLFLILGITLEISARGFLKKSGANGSKGTGRFRDDCPKKIAFTSLGIVEGRTIEEIIEVVGKPNNVTDAIDRKVYRWHGVSGKWKYDYTIIVSNDGFSMGYAQKKVSPIG